jgi:hypothetical protein
MLGIHVLEKMSNGSGGDGTERKSGLAKVSNTSFSPSWQYNASRDAVECEQAMYTFLYYNIWKDVR